MCKRAWYRKKYIVSTTFCTHSDVEQQKCGDHEKKRFKLEVASSNEDNMQPRKARKFATNSLRLILTFMLSKWPPVPL